MRQPTSILGGGLRYDVSIIGFQQSFSNNFIGIRRSALFSESGTAWDSDSFRENYTVTRNNDRDKNASFNAEIPGISFTMQIDGFNAFSVGVRARNITWAHNFSPEFAELLYNGLDVPDLWTRLKDQNADLQSLGWTEYYGTYSRKILINEEHSIRVGGTMKLLQGQFAGYFYLEDLDYEFLNDSVFNIYDTYIRYGLSGNPPFDGSGEDFNYGFNGKATFGFDFGAEYEYAPIDKVPSSSKNPCHQAPYLLKAAFSITDIGAIKFPKSELTGDYYANATNIDIGDLAPESLEGFDSILNTFFTELPSSANFNYQLPLSINANLDYNIGKGFFANFDMILSPRRNSNIAKVQYVSRFQLTPRWDSKWFGAYMPFSINTQGNFGLGLTLRAGPLIIGTNDLTVLLGRKVIYAQEFHVALKVPIGFKCKKEATPME